MAQDPAKRGQDGGLVGHWARQTVKQATGPLCAALGCSGLLALCAALAAAAEPVWAGLGCFGLLWAVLGCSGLLWAAWAAPGCFFAWMR